MHRRLHLLPSAVAGALVTVLVLGAWSGPAQAATTALSNVATPSAGHVTGTVTSDAAFVMVSVTGGDPGVFVGEFDADVQAVPSDTHQVAFDLSTWGLGDAADVRVSECADADPSSCGGPVDTASFAPVGATPSVTWPDISKLGTGNGPYTVSVSDPSGGGALYATWTPTGETTPSTWIILDRNGTTDLDLPDGDGDVGILRCHAAGVGPCHLYPGLSAHVTVRRTTSAVVQSITPQFLGPDDTTAPDIQALISVPTGATVTLDLEVRRVTTGSVVPGFGGRFSGLIADGHGEVTVPLDATGLTSGPYELGGTVSYDDPDFGHLEGEVYPGTGSFVVDSSKPVIGSVTAAPATIYPARDGYRDTTTLTTTATDNNPVMSRYEIRDSHGTLVRVLTTGLSWGSDQAVWNGRTQGGAVVAAGQYAVHTVVTDQYGNSSTDDSVTLTVNHQLLVTRTFTRTVSARGSLVDSRVGRCSTLKFPAARGWKGSMGLYTETRCKGSLQATLVSTVQRIRVPAALRYGSLRISAYGGAARAEPRSLAYIAYYHRKDGWKGDKQLRPGLGDHAGVSTAGGGYVYPDRSLYWGVYTALGAKYDVKSFTVRLAYTVLH